MVSNAYHKDISEAVAKGEALWIEWCGKPPYGEYFVPRGKPILTMAKPLIISNGVTGAPLTKHDNPNQPESPREIADAAIESYRRGAAVFHVHLKHPEDGTPCFDPKTFRKTMDMVWDECPDMLTALSPNIDRSKDLTEAMRPLIDELVKYGPKYGDIAFTHASTLTYPKGKSFSVAPEMIQTAVRYLEENGIKPEFECWTVGGPQLVKSCVIDENIGTKPYLIDINFGKEASAMHGELPEYWDIEELISWIKAMPTKDVVRGVWVGGRNWLPLATIAIIMGVDIIGVGMEDAIDLYPFKDNYIESNAQVVKTVATIAKALGREIATPRQAREIMDIDEVKKRVTK